MISLRELVERLELEVVVGSSLDRGVSGVYSGDLLSNVMAKAREGDLWLTVQGHQNVVAVALLTGVAAIVIVEDFEVEDRAAARAEEKGVNILRTGLNAYQLAGRLTALGIA